MKNQINFLEAESLALNLAYKQFYGDAPVGMAFVFINAREQGNPYSDDEKKIALQISNKAIGELKRKNLTKIIEDGQIPDCAMVRRFMATGTGQTLQGYNF
jgi:hypothetical protein